MVIDRAGEENLSAPRAAATNGVKKNSEFLLAVAPRYR